MDAVRRIRDLDVLGQIGKKGAKAARRLLQDDAGVESLIEALRGQTARIEALARRTAEEERRYLRARSPRGRYAVLAGAYVLGRLDKEWKVGKERSRADPADVTRVEPGGGLKVKWLNLLFTFLSGCLVLLIFQSESISVALSRGGDTLTVLMGVVIGLALFSLLVSLRRVRSDAS
jgi:hypothetical protein